MAGKPEPASLIEALKNADTYRAITGSTPGETIAVLENLLGICYASGTYPASAREWRRWVHSSQPLTPAAQWLAQQPDDDWDLFHPTRPLGQNAQLAPYLDEHGAGPAQLVIEHVGDYNQFFDHHHLEHPAPLPAPAAFRAMLAQHLYGTGGRARISGKETLGPTITNLALGRLSARIRVIALGDTLGDTLRLNLTPSADGPGTLNLTWTDGRPRRGFTTKPAGRHVDGPADLHSVLGRSILMRPVTGPGGEPAVDRVLMGAGELLAPLPDRYMQDAVYAKTASGTLKPVWPSAARALWREAHALYAAVAEREKDTDLYGRLALLPARHINLWAVGLISKQTTAISWISDSFPFVPGRQADLRHAASTGSQIAEYIAACLGKAAYTAWTIAYPNPKPADKASQIARFDARGEHWAATAQPFHTLLEAAADGEDLPGALAEYAATITASATEFLTRRLDSLPPNARGYQARAETRARFTDELTSGKAPDYVKEALPS
ncbi:type I-E CRISPR-associated protein Cse1/CasA [Streptomyces sp. TRM 70351]|uniref:type I-E CRISPR-associated protein Cse1/CasA n=1 Tax=Streptomyces sp. TRM 70351 TaxID=3116552 RepID=UPI002E7B6162|nr:type I-E CRISPR-associated protein Cse1/CasA [Streptomyces sp. TRM 70351]MEE1931295.1 type I-E CRISPR-associated protein Cse1/CasA [Streptomyces sp. TRM 70351]